MSPPPCIAAQSCGRSSQPRPEIAFQRVAPRKRSLLTFVPPAPPNSPADGHACSQQEPLSANHHRLSRFEIDALHWVSKLKRWWDQGQQDGSVRESHKSIKRPQSTLLLFLGRWIDGVVLWLSCCSDGPLSVCACALWPGDYVPWIHGAPKNHPLLNCVEICKWKAKQQIKALHAVTADK